MLSSDAVTRTEVLRNLNKTYAKMQFDHKVYTGHHSKKASNNPENNERPNEDILSGED